MKICIKKNVQKGFTLIEMIVVIALISILTVIILFNSTKLNSAILVSNTAYEIGLIVRETQVAGLGVKAAEGSTSGSATFASSHGVYFSMSEPTKIIIFADKNKNSSYDNGEMTQEFNVQNKRAGTVLAICGKKVGSTGVCTPTNTSFTSLATADVVFTRPNPEAIFKVRTVAGGSLADHYGALVVNVGFANDICRSITIEKTGSVQIDSAYCAPIN